MPRVLVADHDRELQILLKVLLSRAGFEVEFASDGPEALRKASGDGYDAIMLELILPELGGVEILDQLRRERPESLKRVIVVTSASRALLQRADGFGVHAVFRKPFEIRDLLRATAECSHGH